MGFNLVVFRWAPGLASAAARKRRGVTFDAVYASECDGTENAALGEGPDPAFLRDVERDVGAPGERYLLERHPRALVFDLPFSEVPELVSRLGALARRHGLTSVGR